MKPKSTAYFPVTPDEQAILLRLREADLQTAQAEVLAMLDLLAETKVTAGDLEQAISLLVASRQSEGLDARFANLEARLRERVERALVELEGRLSRRLTTEVRPERSPTVASPTTPAAPAPAAPTPAAETPQTTSVPPDASVAFRIDGEMVAAPKAAQFYVAVWRWLFDHGKAQLSDLPIQAGKKRFVIARSAVHPTGQAFTRAVQAVPGAFVEVNLSRADIIGKAKKHLTHYGVPFDVVVGDSDGE